MLNLRFHKTKPIKNSFFIKYDFSVALEIKNIIGPRREKTCLWGFWNGHTQTSQLSYRH